MAPTRYSLLAIAHLSFVAPIPTEDEFVDLEQDLLSAGVKHGSMLFLDSKALPVVSKEEETSLDLGDDDEDLEVIPETLVFRGIDLDEFVDYRRTEIATAQESVAELATKVNVFLRSLPAEGRKEGPTQFIAELERELSNITAMLNRSSSRSKRPSLTQETDAARGGTAGSSGRAVSSSSDNDCPKIPTKRHEQRDREAPSTSADVGDGEEDEKESKGAEWELRRVKKKLRATKAELGTLTEKYTKLRAQAKRMNDAGFKLKADSEANELLLRKKISRRDAKIRQLQELIDKMREERNSADSKGNSTYRQIARPPSRPLSQPSASSTKLNSSRYRRGSQGNNSEGTGPVGGGAYNVIRALQSGNRADGSTSHALEPRQFENL